MICLSLLKRSSSTNKSLINESVQRWENEFNAFKSFQLCSNAFYFASVLIKITYPKILNPTEFKSVEFEYMRVVALKSQGRVEGGGLGRVTNTKTDNSRKQRNTMNWRIKTFLIKLLYLTLRRSTMTYSMRSRCSSFGPNTIRLRAELTCSSPV